MAEGLLFNTIEKLIGKLGSVVVESWNMRDDLGKLVQNMSEIKAVVLDAEEQQSTNNHQVQLWLEMLKDALHDADDLLDDFNTEELRRQVMTSDKKAKKFRIFFSSSNQIFYSFKMAGKIKELGKIIEDLNVGKRTFNFTNRTPERRVLKQRETHSFVREEEVIGREEEKKELLELLFDNSINVKDNVSVISIIGVGGLGKTTLAQHVYNDKQVQQHFELKKWVCVSDDFDVKGIAAKIIGSKINIVEMDKVQLELREKVEGKRYLLVLDDIWSEDGELWLQLMTLLKDGAKGSKIIITTRSEKVAKVCRSSSIFFLKGLDEKQSWRLFSQLAFENEKDLENENLVSIGKEIVKKCSGVPLAIRIIGCLMLTMEDWSTFKNKDLVKIDEQGGNKIFQLIKLSYDHLPFHLKNCFAFCSLFPQDFLIEKQMLIRLWIAQGFVQSSGENISLEDIGEKYFMDFVHKSFFQNITERFGGKVCFQMHDIVHDLASVISRSEYLLVKERGQHVDKKNRHVSFGFKLDSSWQVPTSLLNAYKLRTFLLPLHTIYYYETSMEVSAHACISILSSFSRFRVLHLNYTVSMKIPSCIGRMKHLRYLDLSFSIKVEELPRSITKLINLETLLLNHCESLRELPKDLWKLVSLRHLELDGCDSLTCMPRGIGKMTNLQTLTLFVLDATSKDSASASELRGLNNLRGELEIKGLECLRHCPTEVKHINLMGKPHLHRLTLNWNSQIVGDVNDLEKDDIILHDIVMHSNITFLTIVGFGGVTMSSLVNLSTSLDELSLHNCTRLQYLDNNGDNSSSTFCASLTDITLHNLPNLKGWCKCSEEEMSKGCCHQFKSLGNLWIVDCHNLISIPQHTDIKNIFLRDVTSKILQQAVTHSNVEFLDLNNILNFKSLSGVLQHLTTLFKLTIGDCTEFDPCNDEDGCYSMKWKELTNLRELTFFKLPKMKYLPEGLQHITTLQTLKILQCENLTSIPEWATSLQVLHIYGCPMVTPLPTEVEDQ